MNNYEPSKFSIFYQKHETSILIVCGIAFAIVCAIAPFSITFPFMWGFGGLGIIFLLTNYFVLYRWICRKESSSPFTIASFFLFFGLLACPTLIIKLLSPLAFIVDPASPIYNRLWDRMEDVDKSSNKS